ncbi:unnamed protein product [Somion occarium]|uniref:F-box domain-containing protein n=1 Tax=Somion occarium TaxID=3059160 RepID=A0ABP1DPU1_9APHY
MRNASASSPVLPQELIDEILGHLWNDIPSLHSCTLVHSSWLPTSRLHLFHTLNVTCEVKTHSPAFQNLMASLRFGDLSDKCHLIFELCLRGSDTSSSSERQGPLFISTLAMIITQIPNLRRLELRNLHIAVDVTPENFRRAACDSVESLVMISVMIISTGDSSGNRLGRLYALFPRIQELQLSQFYLEEESDHFPLATGRTFPSLRSFAVSLMDYTTDPEELIIIYRRLLSVSPVLRLYVFGFDTRSGTGWVAAGRNTLEHLHLQISGTSQRFNPNVFDLSLFSRLKSVHISVEIEPLDRRVFAKMDGKPLRDLFTFIQSVLLDAGYPPQLQSLILKLRVISQNLTHTALEFAPNSLSKWEEMGDAINLMSSEMEVTVIILEHLRGMGRRSDWEQMDSWMTATRLGDPELKLKACKNIYKSGRFDVVNMRAF